MVALEDVLSSLLQGCLKNKDLAGGRQVHRIMVCYGLQSVSTLGNQLIRLFALCGSLADANYVFYDISKPTIYTWDAIISAHVMLGENKGALQLYYQMQEDETKPCKFIFSSVLKACGKIESIEQGNLLHAQVIRSRLETNIVVGSAIVSMYAKCGSLEEACTMLDTLPKRDVVSWNAIISGCTRHGRSVPALEFFLRMQQEDIKPSKVSFLCILKGCGSIGAIGQGRLIHAHIIRGELETDVVIGSTLIDMYAKSGSAEDARKTFDKLPNRNLVSWNAMLTGYTQHGLDAATLELFREMQGRGVKPDKVTYSLSLKACGSLGAITLGRLIHYEIIEVGLESNLIVGNSLIDMYAKCGILEEAEMVFGHLPITDDVSWGAMITGYTYHGCDLLAFELFERIQQECFDPGRVAFLSILNSCSTVGDSTRGRMIHFEMMMSGLDSDEMIGSSLITMYAKCWCLEEACMLFDNLPRKNAASWGAMIAGYGQYGQGPLAFELFEKMQMEGLCPNKVTFLCVLKACSAPESICQGRLIHGQIVRRELQSDVVIGSTLINMYCKCGILEEARRVFDGLPDRNAVSYNAMLEGYGQDDNGGLASLKLFKEMIEEGIIPDKVTFLCLLKACGSLGARGHGKFLHEQMIRNGLGYDVITGTAIVDMYIKCGSLDNACSIFNELEYHNVVSWNAMIAGYSEHGDICQAEQCLEKMQLQGFKPNSRTYTSILGACSHAGAMEKGRHYFKSMREDHGITPSLEHFNCMVDLLGRAGHLDSAEELLQTMPASPEISMWEALLTACRMHGDTELGRHCFSEAFHLDPYSAAGYELLSKVFADAHILNDANRIEELRKCASAWKKPGISCIEVHRKIHNFKVGDRTHLQANNICAKLERLRWFMKEEGYLPHLSMLVEVMPG